MEIALIAVKLLRWGGNFLFILIRAGAGFFRLVFGELIYKILVKIYYRLFRLKKNDLANKTWSEWLKEKRLYWFVLAVAVIILTGNFVNRGQAASLETKIPQTVMSHLVGTEFSSLAIEQLVEETASPGAMQTAGQEKYASNSCLLQKQSGLPIDEPDNNNNFIFNDEGDFVYKPALTTTGQIGQGVTVTQRTEIAYYTVQNSDTVSSIAHKFGLTVNTMLWANNLTANSLIRPGDTLTILPYSGILYTVKNGDTVSKIAANYGISSDNILSCNNLSAGLKAGQKIIVPGAKKITEVAVVPKTTTSRTGLSLIRDFVQSTPTKSTGSGKMAWPTVGHTITQYFSWRHTAVDIANKQGTPVYAADDGVVIFAGWATGYGNSIVIDHGNGLKTRYGHASKLFVSVGDEVSRGENIMAMGTTGWSTGPHVHFEVMVNGTKVNPLNYIR